MVLGHFSTFLITSNTELLDARGAAASEDIKLYLDALIGGSDCTTIKFSGNLRDKTMNNILLIMIDKVTPSID